MEALTVQLYLDGRWHDAMEIDFHRPADGHASPCLLGYQPPYVVEQLHRIGSAGAAAASATLPLAWHHVNTPQWPAFLFDVEPSGSARRFLMQRLGMPARADADAATDLQLLAQCTPAPVGHLRILSSVQAASGSPIGFAVDEVVERDAGFLDYAYAQGAAIGGATGAGGEAPKLLLTEDENGLLHPDAALDDVRARRHWFVKFARGKASPVDQTILRAEHAYYRALQQLGIATAGGDGMRLEQAARPSLWLPRFDRATGDRGVQRIAVESIYSLAGVTRPGSAMTHPQAVEALVRAWIATGQAQDIPTLLRDYLRRDLINRVLGNSDNHGRNMAVLRHAERVELAPIYDLAPMVMDEEGIVRTTRWPEPLERGGMDWRGACRALQPWGDPEQLFAELREDASMLRALPDLLRDLALPLEVFDHPLIALGRLDERLRRWELLA